jgi:hypothetical protein
VESAQLRGFNSLPLTIGTSVLPPRNFLQQPQAPATSRNFSLDLPLAWHDVKEAMDSLPLEIIANIAAHIPKRIPEEPESRPPLVRLGIGSLSRKWQAALEPYIYGELHGKSTELD